MNASDHGSPRRLLSCLLLALLLPALAPGLSDARPEDGLTVVSESPDGFVVRIRVPEPVRALQEHPEVGVRLTVALPGYVSPGSEAAGAPSLPMRGFPFAVPAGHRAVVTHRVTRSSSFQGPRPAPVPTRTVVPGVPLDTQVETFVEDPQAYAVAGLTPVVEAGPVQGWRFQRVQSLLVRPVSVDLGSGSYSVAREIEVTVRFERETSAVGAPSLVPGEEREVRVGPEPAWDGIQKAVVLNAASARSFATRAMTELPPPVVKEGQVQVRVRFGASGLARVAYSELASQGWPSGVPVDDVQVMERGYNDRVANPFPLTPVPRIVIDSNENGTLDDGDWVIFYGFNYEDRFEPLFSESRFSFFHSYWITHDPEGGVGFSEGDGYPAGDGYTQLTNFPYSAHFEVDNHYINNPRDSGAAFYPLESFIFWLQPSEVDESLSFPAPTPDPAGQMSIRARWEGIFTTAATTNHFVSLKLNDCQLVTDHLFFGRNPYLFSSPPLDIADCMRSSGNLVRLQGRTDQLTSTSGAYFDWFEVTYDRLLVAQNDHLEFNTGEHKGLLEYTVSGFSSDEVVVLDVSDPLDVVLLTPKVDAVGGTFSATVRVNVTGRFPSVLVARVLTEGDLRPEGPNLPPDLGPAVVERGLSRDLLHEGAGSDYILVTHRDHQDAWAPLVAHRESQGHRVFVVNTHEVYDQFAGGDKTPWAIQRFLTQAFKCWDPAPSYLLLGGDASEDYRHSNEQADVDWVPTMMHFNNVPGPGGREMAGTDNWFVGFLAPDSPFLDFVPDMHVGRLPVGSVTEVDAVVQKIIAYESADPDEDWRRRALLVSDDQYSTSITFNTGYCYKSQERSFRLTTEAMADSIVEKGRLAGFLAEPFFLDAYLDTVSTLDREPGNPQNCPKDPTFPNQTALRATTNYSRARVTPRLLEKMDEGYLFVQFTGHANKNLVTTESLLLHRPDLALSNRDLDRLNNLGRPFIFEGYACHLNEFEHAWEGTRGESFGEVLVLSPNRGAVASIASTGYEWLHTNPDAQIYTTRPFFWDLPRDPETGRPRRVLGEALTRGLVANAAENGGFQFNDWNEMLRTYMLLGDPATRIDIWDVQFQVSLDGSPVGNETRLFADSFDDSLAIDAILSDDVDVSTIRVMEGDLVVPAERIALVQPDPTDQGAQFYGVSFRTALRLGTYDVALEATDWSGRMSSFRFPVQYNTVFSADGSLLDPGGLNLIDPESEVSIAIETPVPMQATDFEVLLDEVPVTATLDADDESGRFWTARLVGLDWTGDHRVGIRASGGGESVTRSVDVAARGDDLSLLNVYFYPNPYEVLPGGLIYELSRAAETAQVSVYTVKGRRVLSTPGPVRAGRNQFTWDFRDDTGEEVANGVYLFVLELSGPGGEQIRHLERVAVAR